MNIKGYNFDAIDKYVNPDLVVRFESLFKEDSGKIKITNTGMVSSGKSSLYNILIDSDGYFKTGAARTTISANMFDKGDCEFIDTPGIDVDEEDDEIAYKTVMGSDIIMMIHNIKTGPLQATEVEWLQKIVDNIDDPEAVKKRLIFVCSWKDSREKDDNYQEIFEIVKNMVYDITKVKIPVFDVSVRKYLAGVEKGAQVLIESSNVLQLQRYLSDYSKEYVNIRKKLQVSTKTKVLNEIQDELKLKQNEIENQITITEEKVEVIYQQKIDTWDKIVDLYISKQRNISSLISQNLSDTLAAFGELSKEISDYWDNNN